MKALIATAFALSLAIPCQAQTSYSNGFHDGYYDRIPMSGPPDPSTEYGRGWHNGYNDLGPNYPINNDNSPHTLTPREEADAALQELITRLHNENISR